MSATATETPVLLEITPGGAEARRRVRRRRLVRGAIVGACLLYLAIVLIGPLVGILYNDSKVKAIMDTRCIACHDGSNPHRLPC